MEGGCEVVCKGWGGGRLACVQTGHTDIEIYIHAPSKESPSSSSYATIPRTGPRAMSVGREGVSIGVMTDRWAVSGA